MSDMQRVQISGRKDDLRRRKVLLDDVEVGTCATLAARFSRTACKFWPVGTDYRAEGWHYETMREMRERLPQDWADYRAGAD